MGSPGGHPITTRDQHLRHAHDVNVGGARGAHKMSLVVRNLCDVGLGVTD